MTRYDYEFEVIPQTQFSEWLAKKDQTLRIHTAHFEGGQVKLLLERTSAYGAIPKTPELVRG